MYLFVQWDRVKKDVSHKEQLLGCRGIFGPCFFFFLEIGSSYGCIPWSIGIWIHTWECKQRLNVHLHTYCYYYINYCTLKFLSTLYYAARPLIFMGWRTLLCGPEASNKHQFLWKEDYFSQRRQARRKKRAWPKETFDPHELDKGDTKEESLTHTS